MKKLKLQTSYSQRDPKWANTFLGFNTHTYTIGTDGCLLTTLANYLNAVDIATTPKILNDSLKAVNGFVSGGFYVWEAITKVYPDVRLEYVSKRYSGVSTPPGFFDDMREHIDNGEFVFCEIDFNPSQVGEQMHWVGVYGYDDKDFFILDPWTGSKTTLEIYGDPRNSAYMFRTYNKRVPFEVDECQEKILKLEEEVVGLRNSRNEHRAKEEQLQDSLDRSVELTKSWEDKLIASQLVLDTTRTELDTTIKERDSATLKVNELNKTIKDKNDIILKLTDRKYTVIQCLDFILEAIKEKRLK